MAKLYILVDREQWPCWEKYTYEIKTQPRNGCSNRRYAKQLQYFAVNNANGNHDLDLYWVGYRYVYFGNWLNQLHFPTSFLKITSVCIIHREPLTRIMPNDWSIDHQY